MGWRPLFLPQPVQAASTHLHTTSLGESCCGEPQTTKHNTRTVTQTAPEFMHWFSPPAGRLAYGDTQSRRMTLSQQVSSNIPCSFSTQPRAANLNPLLIPNWPNAPAGSTGSINTADERPVSNHHTHVREVAFYQVLPKCLRSAQFRKFQIF